MRPLTTRLVMHTRSLLLGLVIALPLAAQPPKAYPSSWDPTLLQRADVKAAMAHL